MSIKSGQKGQSLVEVALVLPVLIILLFGIMEGGRLFGGYIELQSAARDAARYASIHSKDFTPAEAAAWGTANLPAYINSRLVLLNPSNLTFSLFKDASVAADTKINLSLNYQMEMMTPFVGSILSNNTGIVNLSASMTMRGE